MSNDKPTFCYYCDFPVEPADWLSKEEIICKVCYRKIEKPKMRFYNVEGVSREVSGIIGSAKQRRRKQDGRINPDSPIRAYNSRLIACIECGSMETNFNAKRIKCFNCGILMSLQEREDELVKNLTESEKRRKLYDLD